MTARGGTEARGRKVAEAEALLALVAFAANSLFARLALGAGAIDAASYTAVRIGSGAAALWLIVQLTSRGTGRRIGGDWQSALLLVGYALPFSLAYLELTTGTGALILFGAVQATMIASGLAAGERPSARTWAGLVIAMGGLVALVMPGLDRVSPVGALLMTVAGIAWGAYSIRGRRGTAPLADTTGNFLRGTPLALAGLLIPGGGPVLTTAGIGWAVASGALASGVGYAIWYRALPKLSATGAATLQLAVPVLAGWAGVVVLGEQVTARLVLAGAAILGGIALARDR
ncbi:MAG TPA: DMT family transporter [Gemmatimonadales bacterium]